MAAGPSRSSWSLGDALLMLGSLIEQGLKGEWVVDAPLTHALVDTAMRMPFAHGAVICRGL